MNHDEAEKQAREVLKTMEEYYKGKYLAAAKELEEKHKVALQEHQDAITEIYDRGADELTKDYQEYVGKIGVISGLVGVLIGLALATIIQIIFK